MATPIYSPSSWGSLTKPDFNTPDFLNFDVAPGMAPSNALSPLTNVPAGVSPGMFSGLGDWMNNSGVLGKTLADGTKMQGWGAPALGLASGLMNGWMGMQQLRLAKDTLASNKEQFNKNYEAQRKTTNASLEDRQRSRVASNSTAYQSVGDYMKKNGI
jgi:hypothetical protein